MIWQLARPSFWPEPRDPWAWQSALRTLAKVAPIQDPRPCWGLHLHSTLSRRSVAGLYGLKLKPMPATVLGVGLLQNTSEGWVLGSRATELAESNRENFQLGLAEVLVRQSAWVRLALIELTAGRWDLPQGVGPLQAVRQIRVGHELRVPNDTLKQLPDAAQLLGDLDVDGGDTIATKIAVTRLSALHAPLYLLAAIGWLDEAGRPTIPDHLTASLGLETPAAVLRKIAAEEQDARGFVPIARVAERLHCALNGNGQNCDLGAWTDGVIGGAIEAGTIEVHAWAPGQPRHGRGLYGDRDRKLVRWTVHNDLQLTSTDEGQKVDQ